MIIHLFNHLELSHIICGNKNCLKPPTRIYLDLRKDTFARFLPLGRISSEGAGNGHFFDYCGQFWISCLLG